ncbi:MAG: EAL domain-containing protein [Sulfuricella denitrificans]|nr:EAL domain-containing protein [Sulfuricella denitrificans]
MLPEAINNVKKSRMGENKITLSGIAMGLSRNEFVFYYQPKISLISGKMCGAEALIRWARPDGSLVPPKDFIPLAESTGFITEISRAMFPKLVADLLIVNDIDETLSISFNLSAQDLNSPEILNLIRLAIDNQKINPQRIQVELTEASIINSKDTIVRKNLEELAGLGVTLAMDDYGTGYSSIDSLSQWPFSILKIDQGLIQRIATSEKCATIVQASIRMAHQLGISTVAEGVETQGNYDFLLLSGCTEAQGFLMGEPMPLSELLIYIKKDKRWSGLPIGLIHMAQLDHIQWRKKLIYLITCAGFGDVRDVSIRDMGLELDHHSCRLGKWYYGAGQEFKGHPSFDRLEESHRVVHEISGELLLLAENGFSREEMTTTLRRLIKQSSLMLEMLQELENEALLGYSDLQIFSQWEVK